MRRPDLFIVGAARCGTTALYTYLAQHPGVFMSPIKEPGFFGRDLSGPYWVRDEATYLSLFAAAADGQRVGEATPVYLYSRQAAAEIRAFAPAARILVMLRNPVDMMYSLHGWHLYSGNDDIEDFAAALDAEADRRRGVRLPRGNYSPELLLYRDRAAFSGQLLRYVEAFGRENVHVEILDDLAQDPAALYARVLRFLDLSRDAAPAFAVVNESRRARSGLVRDVLRRPPAVVRHLARVGPLRTAGRWFRAWNAAPARRAPMDPALRRRLQAEFTPEVERLSQLLGRDLTRWTQG